MHSNLNGSGKRRRGETTGWQKLIVFFFNGKRPDTRMTDIFFPHLHIFFFPSSPVSRPCKGRRPYTRPPLHTGGAHTHTALVGLTAAQRTQDDNQTQLVTSSDQGHSSLSLGTQNLMHTLEEHSLPTDFKAHWGKQGNKGTERGLIPECGGPKRERGAAPCRGHAGGVESASNETKKTTKQ